MMANTIVGYWWEAGRSKSRTFATEDERMEFALRLRARGLIVTHEGLPIAPTSMPRYIVDLAHTVDERITVTVRGILAPDAEKAQARAIAWMSSTSWRVVGVDVEVSP